MRHLGYLNGVSAVDDVGRKCRLSGRGKDPLQCEMNVAERSRPAAIKGAHAYPPCLGRHADTQATDGRARDMGAMTVRIDRFNGGLGKVSDVNPVALVLD